MSARCQVDRGSHLPRPPTDPDVRDERIRLLRSWIYWATVDGVDHDGPRQRVALQQPLEAVPGHPSALRPAAQPLVPAASHLRIEPLERGQVSALCRRASPSPRLSWRTQIRPQPPPSLLTLSVSITSHGVRQRGYSPQPAGP